jgi:glutamate-ammonia-ligase adenylyltransferase
VEPAHVRALSDGYDFLRRLESRLRIERDQPGDAIPANQAARLRLARRLGYDGPPPAPTEALVADLARHREAIRTAYFAIVGDDSGPA